MGPASPVYAKYGVEAGNWHTTQWSHIEVTPLVASSPAYHVQGRHHRPQMSKRPCSGVPVQRPTVHWSASDRHALCQRGPIYWKFRGRELPLATGRSASLDHESGTLYLLLFTTQTRPCASGNYWTCFSYSHGHCVGDVELAPL